MTINVLGLDIGGANLKAADTDGNSRQQPFAIWKSRDLLTAELVSLIRPFTNAECLAVTMTAELADCYRTKAEGIRHIVRSVRAAAPALPILCWSVQGSLVQDREIESHIPSLAASNWHALSTWLALQSGPEWSILIDIGSTTADIIPIGANQVQAKGRTDFERMRSGELVYTGIRRTPICAVTQSVNLDGIECPLAAELFATIQDVYLLLNDVPECEDDCDTANGRPATSSEAYDRLIRQLCCDQTEISLAQARLIAHEIAEMQEEQILRNLARVLKTHAGQQFQNVILSGSGRFLGRRVIDKCPELKNVKLREISEFLAPATPESACAYAAAKLAQLSWSRLEDYTSPLKIKPNS